MYELILSGEKAQLKITVYGFENPNVANGSDASWLTVHVYVKLPNFIADYNAAFTTQSFQYFSDSLKSACDNVAKEPEATFYTDEDMLQFSCKFTKIGRIQIHGKSRVHDEPRAVLDFHFDTDLYSMEKFYKQIVAMLNEL